MFDLRWFIRSRTGFGRLFPIEENQDIDVVHPCKVNFVQHPHVCQSGFDLSHNNAYACD